MQTKQDADGKGNGGRKGKMKEYMAQRQIDVSAWPSMQWVARAGSSLLNVGR